MFPPNQIAHMHSLLVRHAREVVLDGSERLALCYWRAAFGTQGALAVAQAISHPVNLITQLQLWHNHVGLDELTVLSNAFRNPNCKVEHLELDGNNLANSETLELLYDMLIHSNVAIKRLSLRNAAIDSHGFEILCDLFTHPSCRLSYVDLDDNLLDEKALLGLGRMMLEDALVLDLKAISLRRCRISANDIRTLINFVKWSPNIPYLRVSYAFPERTQAKRDEQDNVLKEFLHVQEIARSEWFSKLVCMVGVRDLRNSCRSINNSEVGFAKLPKDILRQIAQCLPLGDARHPTSTNDSFLE